MLRIEPIVKDVARTRNIFRYHDLQKVEILKYFQGFFDNFFSRSKKIIVTSTVRTYFYFIQIKAKQRKFQ